MKIKINTNISSEFEETPITINAPELSEEIQNLIQYISNINTIPSQIVASKNNKIYFNEINSKENFKNLIRIYHFNNYHIFSTYDNSFLSLG